MSTVSPVIADIAHWGPDRAPHATLTLDASRAYCRRLARGHYENFTVANWLMPAALRQHFYNVYAYCRWADDLSDEIGDPKESLRLLNWWQTELDACYCGDVRHPVFVALADTIQAFSIPADPFARLLTAFRADQQPTYYETFDELLGYCCNSADPVGELVLYMGRCHTAENVALSNSICTGLQLANFWQDVARDAEIGRVYLPNESRARFGYTDAMLDLRTCNDAFRALLKYEVDRAEELLLAGRPLVACVPRQLRLAVSLYLGGGLAVLERIRDVDYNVWHTRPHLTRWDKLRVAVDAWRASRRS